MTRPSSGVAEFTLTITTLLIRQKPEPGPNSNAQQALTPDWTDSKRHNHSDSAPPCPFQSALYGPSNALSFQANQISQFAILYIIAADIQTSNSSRAFGTGQDIKSTVA